MRYKKYILPLLVMILLALDWTALDDITTGNEPDYWLEYDTLLFSIIIFVLLTYSNLPLIKKWIKEKS
jgi:hypothetical protein